VSVFLNHIAVVNRSSVPDLTIQIICEGYRSYLPHVAKAWDRPVPGLAFYPRGHMQQVAEEAALFIVDSAGDPNAFGAHTMFGKAVWGYVDASLCAELGEPLSRVIGHEIIEPMVNADLQGWSNPLLSGGVEVALEVCDPFQRESKGALAALFGNTAIVEYADFALPSWFDERGQPPYSYLGNGSAPLIENPGGYRIIRKNGRVTLTGASGVSVNGFGRSARILMPAPF
jgi:hypothetical protein